MSLVKSVNVFKKINLKALILYSNKYLFDVCYLGAVKLDISHSIIFPFRFLTSEGNKMERKAKV